MISEPFCVKLIDVGQSSFNLPIGINPDKTGEMPLLSVGESHMMRRTLARTLCP